MPPRPEDVQDAQAQGPQSVTVRLPDLEPIMGLVAACTRLSLHLNQAALDAMPEGAQDALAKIQGILWRLEHTRVEPQPAPPE